MTWPKSLDIPGNKYHLFQNFIADIPDHFQKENTNIMVKKGGNDGGYLFLDSECNPDYLISLIVNCIFFFILQRRRV